MSLTRILSVTGLTAALLAPATAALATEPQVDTYNRICVTETLPGGTPLPEVCVVKPV